MLAFLLCPPNNMIGVVGVIAFSILGSSITTGASQVVVIDDDGSA